ncbi:hypothetical protein BS50DRAFT_641653 [Corynespora cassiicola Philippines]|uniref:Uncharacterized protein n=1 Tax=Corynespora cassiicola Philippines TaxID=1448308 RepID=A0A2T2N0K5_CORCC|nr:hypothetical protein BS50DRAFT_641653 [Corynespora cassiicola Philippines]
MRDKSIRRACKTVGRMAQILHKVHRLNVDFEGVEPRLDDAKSIPELISRTQADPRLAASIDEAVHCLVASLFYFELDAPPDRHNGKYSVIGRVRCMIRRSEPAFERLFSDLLAGSARLAMDDWPIVGSFEDPSSFEKDGNFAMRIAMETDDRFTLSLRRGKDARAYGISGSPFSVQKLVTMQGLDAPFGRADHRKRTRSWSYGVDLPQAKRRRAGGI